MKIKSAQFQTSATDLKSCPRNGLPEFAFIGRSNVGKSSLINLLTEKRDLAKVSATPGKTRLLNFFRINEAWSLVDLPGYGYAKVAKTESADFSEAVATYLEKRTELRRTFVLIDSMLPPQKIDIQFLRWLNDLGLPHSLIFTKTDRQSPTATRRAIAAFNEVLAELNLAAPPAIPCSSKNKDGRGEILKVITEDLAGPKNAKRSASATTEPPAPAERPVFKPTPTPAPQAAEIPSPKPSAEAAPRAMRERPAARAAQAEPEPRSAPVKGDEPDFFARTGKKRAWKP